MAAILATLNKSTIKRVCFAAFFCIVDFNFESSSSKKKAVSGSKKATLIVFTLLSYG